MKRLLKALIRDAEAAGYEHVDTNCRGALRFEHPHRPLFLLNPGADEHMVRKLRALAGLDEHGPKRNAVAVRGRQAQERERCRREQQAHQARLDELLAAKSRMLAGHAAHLSTTEVLRIEREIERAEREVSRYAALMTALPATAEHGGSGRARHRAGAR